jgi:hypothetical protein
MKRLFIALSVFLLAGAILALPLPLAFVKNPPAVAAGGGASWVPTNTTSATNILWFRADNATLVALGDGGAVGTWPDESGNGRNATQATASAKPTFKTNQKGALPGVLFDGVDDIMNFAMTGWGLTNAFQVTVAYKFMASADYFQGPIMHASNGIAGFLCVGESSAGHTPHLCVKSSVESTETANKKGSFFPGTNTLFVASWTWNGTTATLKTNAVADAVVNGGVNYGSGNGGALGKGWTSGNFKQMLICEVAVWNGVLNAAETSSNDVYFARWAP